MNNIKPELSSLEKKYFFLPRICREEIKKAGMNLYDRIKSMEDKSLFEQIDEKDNKISKTKRSLHFEKKGLMKKLLIENKAIPSSWKAKLNFSNFVEEALKDNYVLNRFTQNIKDYSDKRTYNWMVFNNRIKSEISNPLFMQKKYHSIKLYNFKQKNQMMSITNQNLFKNRLFNERSNIIEHYEKTNNTQTTSNNLRKQNEKEKNNLLTNNIKEETRTSFLITQNEYKDKTKIGTIKNKVQKLIKSFSTPLCL